MLFLWLLRTLLAHVFLVKLFKTVHTLSFWRGLLLIHLTTQIFELGWGYFETLCNHATIVVQIVF